jgi:hypothetical protein
MIRKKIKNLFLVNIIFLSLNPLLASTRGDVKIIEATESIQYLSQKIAINYFVFYNKQKDSMLKDELDKNIRKLEFYISEISNTTKSSSTKAILNYFTYRIGEMKALQYQEINESNARTILEHSEGFLEGALAIAEEHKYKFSKEEKMLMLSKKAQYLIERVNTYYMASQIGFKSDDNHQKMKTAIKEVDRAIQNIEQYQYPYRLKNKVEKFKNIWSINRDFFNQKDASPLPYLLLASTKYGQNLLTDIEQYHKKNL